MRVIKEIWSKIGKPFKYGSGRSGNAGNAVATAEENEVIVRKPKKPDPLEVVTKAFDTLTDHLGTLNTSLDAQLGVQKQLLSKFDLLQQQMNKLPVTSEKAAEQQAKIAQTISDYLEQSSQINTRLTETAEKLPAQAAKNTQVLNELNQCVDRSSKASVEISEKVAHFDNTIEKLDSTAVSQTESILQMNRTFSVSDKYLKYMLKKQSTRFMWVMAFALFVSLVSIAAVVAMVIYLKP